MAVYTKISHKEIAQFLTGYGGGVGALRNAKPIAEGVENSNYFLTTASGKFVLTLYEARVRPEDVPFFLGLMNHLHADGVRCPRALEHQSGQVFDWLAGRPAAVMTFLEGRAALTPDAETCRRAGFLLARFHQSGLSYKGRQENRYAPQRMGELLRVCASFAGGQKYVAEVEEDLAAIERGWPRALPQGAIHGDLFPDNVLFAGGEGGCVDFCFACQDSLAYDLAICCNAWCFIDGAFRPALWRAFREGYESLRVLRDDEKRALPLLCRGAALRFFLTRLHDLVSGRTAASGAQAKDPAEYLARLRFYRERQSAGGGHDKAEIWTDGACSGNPGPGGWGVVIHADGRERHLSGYQEATTNNRMELLAAIKALEAVEAAEIHLYTDSTYVRDGITAWISKWRVNGWRSSGRKPVRNVDLWKQLDALAAGRRISWHWVRGHTGDINNTKADELARTAIIVRNGV